jgi:hypothetical protein
MSRTVSGYGFRQDNYGLFAFDTSGLDTLAADLKISSKVLVETFQSELDDIGQTVASEARQIATATSRSSRLPGSIKTVRRGLKIRVVAGFAEAPIAGLWEYGSLKNPRSVRWPLFGDREHWMSMPTRPFLRPAAEHVQPEIETKVLRVVDEATKVFGG